MTEHLREKIEALIGEWTEHAGRGRWGEDASNAYEECASDLRALASVASEPETPKESYESRSPDGDGPLVHLGLGLGEVGLIGRNTESDAHAPSVRAPNVAAGSEPADSHSTDVPTARETELRIIAQEAVLKTIPTLTAEIARLRDELEQQEETQQAMIGSNQHNYDRAEKAEADLARLTAERDARTPRER